MESKGDPKEFPLVSDRWWTLLGVAIQDALAASVLAPSCSGLVLDASTSCEPEIDRLLDDERL